MVCGLSLIDDGMKGHTSSESGCVERGRLPGLQQRHHPRIAVFSSLLGWCFAAIIWFNGVGTLQSNYL